MRTPAAVPPRLPGSVSFSSAPRFQATSPRAAATSSAVFNAVPLGASAFLS